MNSKYNVDVSATDAGYSSTIKKVNASTQTLDDTVKKVSSNVTASFGSMVKAGAALAVGFGAVKLAGAAFREVFEGFGEALNLAPFRMAAREFGEVLDEQRAQRIVAAAGIAPAEDQRRCGQGMW